MDEISVGSPTCAVRGRRGVIARVVVSGVLSVSLALGATITSPHTAGAEGSVNVAGLAQGARGDAVRALQQALIAHGVTVKGGADGVFGAGTLAALQQFQSSKGLPATGVVDDATALALGLATSSLLGLTKGARGEAVTDLQRRLIAAGGSVRGGADGVFGSATAEAVAAFQSSKGLSPTGAVDPATAAALGSIAPAAPTPAPAAPSPTPDPAVPTSPLGLRIGARGELVKALQQQLLAAGFTGVGKIDGVFGALTSNALSSFQRSNGLASTGEVDQPTIDALARIGQGGGAPSVGMLGLVAGAAGSAVQQLQQALINAGVNVRGGADGRFGAATLRALNAYQRGVGLGETTAVDQPTIDALAAGKTVTTTPGALAGLKAGSLGTAVRSLQEQLIKLGVTVRGGADGIFGPATSNAVKAFQNSQGIAATGVVDDATVTALANPKPVSPPSGGTGGSGGSGGSGGGAALGFAKFGEKGERVLALQAALVAAGITPRGGVDGEFGGGTSAAVMDFQRAKGLSVTGKVDDATAAALGLAAGAEPSIPDPASVSIAVFPVQGKCYYGDSYGYPRSGGRVHLGVDIMAPAGNLLYAVADGTITKIYADYPGSLAGNGIRLTTEDGTYFFYAHMTGIATGLAVGTKVTAGQIVGTVGSTGNSAANHLHFEVHPKGGSAVNPYPIVKAVDACKVTDPLPQP